MEDVERTNLMPWVGFIAVLALVGLAVGIAVPNYHETTSYKRNTALNSQFRALATALEAYATTEHTYPTTLDALTTPVAYIEAIPADVWASRSSSTGLKPTYLYAPLRATGPGAYGWFLASCGPATAQDIVPERDLPPGATLTVGEIEKRLAPMSFDPTNGSFSRGAIFRIGGAKKK